MTAGDGTQLAKAIAPLWTEERTRGALGISRAAMDERRKAGSLLGVQTSDGDFFYPLAQFERDDEGKVRVRPMVRTFLMVLREHDAWAVALVLNARADELDGLTPLDWARENRDADPLVEYAHVLDSEWSR